jgi:hypothetical protein
MRADGVQIVFDATSAYVHRENSCEVDAEGAMMVDLTPRPSLPLPLGRSAHAQEHRRIHPRHGRRDRAGRQRTLGLALKPAFAQVAAMATFGSR